METSTGPHTENKTHRFKLEISTMISCCGKKLNALNHNCSPFADLLGEPVFTECLLSARCKFTVYHKPSYESGQWWGSETEHEIEFKDLYEISVNLGNIGSKKSTIQS